MASDRPIFNTEAIHRVFNPTTMLLKAGNADKPGEEKLKISCKYERGDKVCYKWIKDELRTGTVTHIDFCVNVKDSVTDTIRSVVLKDVVGYATDK